MSAPALTPEVVELLQSLGIRIVRDARGVAMVAQEPRPMRRVCSFCGAELAGSVPMAAMVSHGVCEPLCEPAREKGWENA